MEGDNHQPTPAGAVMAALPVPLPQPFPAPLPIPGPISPLPWPDEDWWKYLRFKPISGLYSGAMTAPKSGAYRLDLRMDIDTRSQNSPVLNIVSGDISQVFSFQLPGRRPSLTWTVYRESWIVDKPTAAWTKGLVIVTGDVRFWKGTHPATSIEIRIPWAFGAIQPAQVTITEAGGTVGTYQCERVSDSYRSINLEIDVCSSVNTTPLIPTCDTCWHANRPVDLPERMLTIEEAYKDAGVAVTIRPDHTVIDDSDPRFTSWSPAELHDAMLTHFSQYGGAWPRWELWGVMAGRFDDAGVGGIMFDAAAMYGGAGEGPDRQGFAVFRRHPWFNNLMDVAPTNQDQAWSARHFLYTWVHEAGHAFNLLHSWNKGRADSLSWMNYDWKYDGLAGNHAGDFWKRFYFRFDDQELLHIRHGDRAAVIMGGDPWASGGHLEAPVDALALVEGAMPVELLIRSKEYFEFMEPVTVELRLRNPLPDLAIDLDTRLNPEYGVVALYIRRPNGTTVQFSPLMCRLGDPKVDTFKPPTAAVQGEDRYSEEVFLSYGADGFYFDRPGEYLVRAVYQGLGDVQIWSNTHRIRIGTPVSAAEDRQAHDYFTHDVGMCLYLNGSSSPHLTEGMQVLANLAGTHKESYLGAKIATVLAKNAARAFFRIQDISQPTLAQVKASEPEAMLALSAPVVKFYRREKVKANNLPYHEIVRERSACLVALGQDVEAKKEVANLHKDLASRGVNQPVLDDIKAYAASL